MENNIRRILIVRTDRIGDVILTLPMARVLKEHFKDIYVAMLVQRYTSELVEDDENVDKVLYHDSEGTLVTIKDLVSMIRKEKFDVVFHTHPRFRLAFITWLARVPIRVGTGYRWYSFMFNRKVYEHRKYADYHEMEYNLHLLSALNFSFDMKKVKPILPVDPGATEKVASLLSGLGITSADRVVIIHPGSGKSARDWRPDNFGILGRRLLESGRFKILIMGGSEEDELVKNVKSIAGSEALSIKNKLSLKEYAALLKTAALFVGNSSGPIHMAAAVGTPVVGLYPQITALSDRRWGPYTAKKIVLSPDGDQPIDCKTCVRKKGVPCECMDTISVDDVYTAAMSFFPPDIQKGTN